MHLDTILQKFTWLRYALSQAPTSCLCSDLSCYLDRHCSL